jgi:hypothetical protein
VQPTIQTEEDLVQLVQKVVLHLVPTLHQEANLTQDHTLQALILVLLEAVEAMAAVVAEDHLAVAEEAEEVNILKFKLQTLFKNV